MKNYTRDDTCFSLCGLNCGLCPMYHMKDPCTGCGGQGRPSCAIIRCSLEHGGVAYCALCEAYPCERYEKVNPHDSFITYRNVLKDFERLRTEGEEAYRKNLDAKVEILRELLENYNDGRRKSFFCLAVNLLELEDIRTVMARIASELDPAADLKEKGRFAAGVFQKMAEKRGITLKLNKKKKTPKGS